MDGKAFREKVGNQAGLTLVEVVVAIGILAFVVLGIAQLMGLAMALQTSTQRQTSMVAMGQQILEDLMTRPLGDPALSNTLWSFWDTNCRNPSRWLNCYNHANYNGHRWPAALTDPAVQRCQCVVVWDVQQFPAGGHVGAYALLRVTVIPVATLGRPVVLFGIATGQAR
ncbi:MAG: prepilin-type N-terminal cleavage/methylation domain-containing protein [Acidobacteria bacterium]|nr:prepilin-type N-terminal cleavage/methylation domain-containing protein [Acidobacteriota bacterium]MDW7984660.1 prepilin-type N-terminal cleavage/methylation domain-containing protein [Acidobacteriota bacterium]